MLNPLIEYCPNGLNLKQGENKMKTRIITGIMIVALVALSAGVAAAQYGQGDGNGTEYVDGDGNGNGINDNIGTCPRFVDANGDGVCGNNYGYGCGGSGNFVDEDGDGVCDNYGTNGRDADGDGIPNGLDDDYERLQDGSGNSGNCNGCNR